MLVHYTCNNTNYLFILLETCVTCVTSVTLPLHLPTIVSARKPNKTAKTFEKIGKTSEKIGKTFEKIGKTLWSLSLLRRAKQTSSNISRCQPDARSASRAGGEKQGEIISRITRINLWVSIFEIRIYCSAFSRRWMQSSRLSYHQGISTL